MNSLESILLFNQRPAVQGYLQKQARLRDDFPVIPPPGQTRKNAWKWPVPGPKAGVLGSVSAFGELKWGLRQHFCSSSKCLMYGYSFPAVVKVGSAHAGAGKMKITERVLDRI